VLPLFAQELSTSCVAACLRMALAALGFSLTESEIRSRCDHTHLGMRLNQVVQGLADLPIEVEYHTDWSIDDLTDAVRQSIFPIVGIDLRFVEGAFAFHAVVVADVMSGHVIVHDPWNSQSPQSISLQTFEDAWESADRECLVIEMKQRG
jgi:ABC-type bacteriocin/lantibiotic exporter with double-glycine peptidase domain